MNIQLDNSIIYFLRENDDLISFFKKLFSYEIKSEKLVWTKNGYMIEFLCSSESERSFWAKTHYFYLYVWASLMDWTRITNNEIVQKRRDIFIDRNKEKLSEEICLFANKATNDSTDEIPISIIERIGVYIDDFRWKETLVTPFVPVIFHQRKEELLSDSLYAHYYAIFKNILDSIKTEDIISNINSYSNYCKIIDICFKRNKCFSELTWRVRNYKLPDEYYYPMIKFSLFEADEINEIIINDFSNKIEYLYENDECHYYHIDNMRLGYSYIEDSKIKGNMRLGYSYIEDSKIKGNMRLLQDSLWIEYRATRMFFDANGYILKSISISNDVFSEQQGSFQILSIQILEDNVCYHDLTYNEIIPILNKRGFVEKASLRNVEDLRYCSTWVKTRPSYICNIYIEFWAYEEPCKNIRKPKEVPLEVAKNKKGAFRALRIDLNSSKQQ